MFKGLKPVLAMAMGLSLVNVGTSIGMFSDRESGGMSQAEQEAQRRAAVIIDMLKDTNQMLVDTGDNLTSKMTEFFIAQADKMIKDLTGENVYKTSRFGTRLCLTFRERYKGSSEVLSVLTEKFIILCRENLQNVIDTYGSLFCVLNDDLRLLPLDLFD